MTAPRGYGSKPITVPVDNWLSRHVLPALSL